MLEKRRSTLLGNIRRQKFSECRKGNRQNRQNRQWSRGVCYHAYFSRTIVCFYCGWEEPPEPSKLSKPPKPSNATRPLDHTPLFGHLEICPVQNWSRANIQEPSSRPQAQCCTKFADPWVQDPYPLLGCSLTRSWGDRDSSEYQHWIKSVSHMCLFRQNQPCTKSWLPYFVTFAPLPEGESVLFRCRETPSFLCEILQ